MENSAKHNSQNTFTFTNNIDYVCEHAVMGQVHFIISPDTKSIMATIAIHKKILMNDGTSILLSEFNNYTVNNQKEFTSLKNWFSYDDFTNMVNQMNWIQSVRVNEGESWLSFLRGIPAIAEFHCWLRNADFADFADFAD